MLVERNVDGRPLGEFGSYWIDYAYPRSPRICVAYGWRRCQSRHQNMVGALHEPTPAKTLVISSTLMPDSGRLVVVLAVAM